VSATCSIIKNYANDPEQYRLVGRNLKSTIIRLFDVQNVIEQYDFIYQD
jgi:hypothetical protein